MNNSLFEGVHFTQPVRKEDIIENHKIDELMNFPIIQVVIKSFSRSIDKRITEENSSDVFCY